MSGICRIVCGMTTEQAEKYAKQIAGRLRAEAFARRVSQGAIAQAAGVSRSTINEYLNGHTPIPMGAYLDICTALNISPQGLIAEIQDSE